MTQKLPEFAKIERFALRPVFLLITFVLVLLAIVQVGGRFTMAVLHLFEPQINALAVTQNVQITGLQGNWRGFNPVLSASRVTFGGGHVEGVEVELDLLESAVRNIAVLRFGRGEVFLDLVQEAGGWRLRGAGEQMLDIDVVPMLRYAEDLNTTARLQFTNAAGRVSDLAAQAMLVHRAGQRYAQLRLGDTDSPHIQGRVWQDVAEARTQLDLQGELALPSALTGQDQARVQILEGHWFGEQTAGGGALRLNVADLYAPDVPTPVEVGVRMRLSRNAEAVFGAIEQLDLRSAGHTFALGDIALTADLRPSSDRTQPRARFWLPDLNVTALSEFTGSALKEWQALSQWATQAQVRGELRNLHGFFDEEHGLGFAATVTDMAMQSHRGAPTFTGAAGLLWGHTRGVAFRLNSPTMSLAFPRLYHNGWQLTDTQALLQAWFGPGYAALRGFNIKSHVNDTPVAGAFGWTRPEERYEQRVGLSILVPEATVADAREFVPYRIPDNLSEWLSFGPQGGALGDAHFAYHGQVHDQPEKLTRRIELFARLEDAHVRYDPAWPDVTGLYGELHVAGRETRAFIQRGRSQEINLGQSTLSLSPGASFAAVKLAARGEGAALLNFIRESPLRDNMAFVTPSWEAAGHMGLTADLIVPLAQEAPDLPELQADLNFELEGLSLVMPDYRLSMSDMRGAGTFSLPHHLSGEFSAQIFDAAADITARHSPEWLTFSINGVARPRDVYELAGMTPLKLLEGQFKFKADLNVAMAEQQITNMAMVTDLQGLEIRLPAELSKTAEEATAAEFDLQFLADYQSLRWQYKETQGWIHFGSDQIERGAIGIGTPPPMTEQTRQAILIRGDMDRVVLSDWVSDDGDAAVGLPQDWEIQNLSVGEFVIGELSFADLTLTGRQVADQVTFNFSAADLEGKVELSDDALLDIDLVKLRLPVDDTEPTDPEVLAAMEIAPALNVALGAAEEDPIDLEVGRSLPAANVTLKTLILGEEPFGSWRFRIEPVADGVQFHDFSVDVNGVHVEGGKLYWDLASNQSHFTGAVRLDDLAQTLPMWDYAPIVSTEEAGFSADASWPGSPANVNVLGLNGEIEFSATDGQFLDMESGGGLRMLSLLNFSNITKRISLDFSDVTGSDVEFDEIRARVALESGQLTFLERMVVNSSASNFQVGGRVDLNSGTLNNEMIVTLPVSDSLPWYGVYLALANPLAGLGIVLGERVFRKPLQAFSSAKYRVTGTLDEPEVKFVGLWDQSMSDPDALEPADASEPATIQVGDAP